MWSARLNIVLFFILYSFSPVYSWVWKCNTSTGFCTRSQDYGSLVNYPSVEVCRLVCGKYGALWPRPTGSTKLSTDLVEFDIRNILFKINEERENAYFLKANTRILQHHKLAPTKNCLSKNRVIVEISTASDDLSLTWSTDESYELDVQTEGQITTVKITAPTAFGARHGLETLSQMIALYKYPASDSYCLVMGREAKIKDAPFYPHRGLLLDTARNFVPVSNIKKHIEAMAASKFNVFHWHMTDSQSFPFESKRLPKMTEYGAYSQREIYRTEEVSDLILYARLRGIRVIIEIDAPSHAGNGWQWGPEEGLGNLTVCFQQQPWRGYCIEPPCGQLNPVNPHVFNVLYDLFADVMDLLPKGEVFHMGGDEVYIPCWNSTPEILNYLSGKDLQSIYTFLDLWGVYQNKSARTFDSVVGNENTTLIVWTSHLTDILTIEQYLPKNRYVIQTWVPAGDPTPANLLTLGYKIIVSTKDAWYLDHGFWGSTVYHDWRTVYNNQIPTHKNTLGGEVCMWGEFVDDHGIEARTWPRAAAAAERLWSNPKTSAGQAECRFYRHRERLVERGINAGALMPKWCYQNEGECS